MDRHTNAMYIINGACNPSGIAHSIVEACAECRNEGIPPQNDAAVRLIVSQLAYIVNVWDGCSDWPKSHPSFGDARLECKEHLSAHDKLVLGLS